MLAIMHDNSVSHTAFPYTFDGNPANTLKFIMSMRIFKRTNIFMHATSAYNRIVTTLPQEVQMGIAELRSEALVKYIGEKVDPADHDVNLDDDEHDEEKFEAYTEAMEKATAKFNKAWGIGKIEDYLMRNYRPSLSRDDIKNALNAIHMRRNENPSLVVERLLYGVKMARESIALMNKTGAADNEMMEYRNPDVQDLFIRVFVTMNCLENDNDGQINKKMQTEVAKQQPARRGLAKGSKVGNAESEFSIQCDPQRLSGETLSSNTSAHLGDSYSQNGGHRPESPTDEKETIPRCPQSANEEYPKTIKKASHQQCLSHQPLLPLRQNWLSQSQTMPCPFQRRWRTNF